MRMFSSPCGIRCFHLAAFLYQVRVARVLSISGKHSRLPSPQLPLPPQMSPPSPEKRFTFVSIAALIISRRALFFMVDDRLLFPIVSPSPNPAPILVCLLHLCIRFAFLLRKPLTIQPGGPYLKMLTELDGLIDEFLASS